ncbi:MAG: TetR/AcrR family transcriptional regulator [Pseudomonadota bacterium]|nr:TetR/AcrR family transcriptional regulator [Pseudomonadota bacterium]
MALPLPLRIRQAAFLLALQRPWHQVTLEAIAREADVSLTELRKITSSRAAILSGFSRDIDESMLANLAKQPPSGEPHDRLFDVILRRLEIMGPYREVVASIIRSPAGDPGEALDLFSAASRSAVWMLAAAGAEADFHWRSINKLSLHHAYWRVVQVWIEDDDPGLAKTMATLDRRLRDAEARAETLRSFGHLAGNARRMVAAFWNRNRDQPTGEP